MRILTITIQVEIDDTTPDDISIDEVLGDIEELCAQKDLALHDQYWEID